MVTAAIALVVGFLWGLLVGWRSCRRTFQTALQNLQNMGYLDTSKQGEQVLDEILKGGPVP